MYMVKTDKREYGPSLLAGHQTIHYVAIALSVIYVLMLVILLKIEHYKLKESFWIVQAFHVAAAVLLSIAAFLSREEIYKSFAERIYQKKTTTSFDLMAVGLFAALFALMPEIVFYLSYHGADRYFDHQDPKIFVVAFLMSYAWAYIFLYFYCVCRILKSQQE